MTVLDAIHEDRLISAYLLVAFLVTAYLTCMVLNELAQWAYRRFRLWRTRRFIKQWCQEDRRRDARRSNDLYGDALIDSVESLQRSADRDNVLRLVGRR